MAQPYPTYDNYEAMVRALQNPNQRLPQRPQQSLNPYGQQASPYPSSIPQARYPSSGAGRIADVAGGVGTMLAPTIARHVIGPSGFGALSSGGPASQGFGAAAGGLAYNPVLSGWQSAGLGLATELGGAALKPKGDLPTQSPFADLTDQYGRREEGSGEGIAGGATKWGGRGAQVGQLFGPVGLGVGAGVGALGGAIGGMFTKNASSATTDFSRADAETAIRQMYQTRGGRDVTPQELSQILVGAGTKPGDQWVGEKGLYSILASLDRNFAAEKGGAAGVSRGLLPGEIPPLPGPPGARQPPPGSLPPGAVARTSTTGTPALTGNPTVDMINAQPGGGGTLPSGTRNDGVYGGTANTSLGTPQEQAQAPPGGQQSPLPGSPPVPPAGTPPVTPPAGTPPAFTGWGKYAGQMEGFDLKRYERDIIGKPNHPEAGAKKILVAQIASTIDPTSKDAVKQLVDKLKAAGQQVEFDGLDRIRFADAPQDGWIDVLKNKQFERTGSGPRAWHWLHNHGEGKGSSAPAGGGTPAAKASAVNPELGYAAGGQVGGGETIAQILARLSELMGQGAGVNGPETARNAVLRHLNA